MRRELPKRLRPPRPQMLQPADAVFTRLCRDLTLASQARERVKSGQDERTDSLAKADRLERESLNYLASYLGARAWAEADRIDDTDDNA